jgi:glycosyltransferase involved in cell wall biosynthesis
LNSEDREIDFSIITPVYNGEKWISETVKSVLDKCKDFNFEYIVINDGSSDSTLKNLLKFSEKITIIDQKNRGEAESVNIGLGSAKGKYILIVNADDPMRSSELLGLAKEIFEQNKNVVCAYPSWSVIDESSKLVRNILVDEFSQRVLIGKHICIVGPGGFFRRETALAIGGRRPNLKFTSDYEFWLRLSQKGKFQRIPGYLAFWREHDLSTSIALRGVTMADERINVIERFLEENSQLPEKLKRMALSSAYYHAAVLVYFDREIPAKKLLFRALLLSPTNSISFEWKVILYIILLPFSNSLLKLIKKIGLLRKLPKQ